MSYKSVFFLLLFFGLSQLGMADEKIVQLDFESGDLSAWKEFPLSGKAEFKILEEGKNHFLRASCGELSESSFQYPIHLELKPGTKLRWRWRMVEAIPHIPEDIVGWGNFPGRLYIYFESTPEFQPNAALAYIWTVRFVTPGWITSPNPAPHRYLSIERGQQKKGQWIQEERDLYPDFKDALGKEPSRMTAIGILVEAVGKGGNAIFDYDDIEMIDPEGK